MKLLIKEGTTAIISLLLFSTSAYSADFTSNQKTKSNYIKNITSEIIGKSVLKKTNNFSNQKTFLAQANAKKTSDNLANSLKNNQSSLFHAANAAKILPADTALFGFINTSSADWKNMGRFQLFKMAGDAISAFIPSDFKNYISFLQPWFGNHIAFAFLPKTSAETASIDSNFLMLAAIKDRQRLQPFINQLKVGAKNVKQQQYKGINILEIETSRPSSLPKKSPLKFPQFRSPTEILKRKPTIRNEKQILAIAVVDGYMGIGNSVKPIKSLIDTATSKGSTETLFDNPKFQPTIEHPLANKAMFGMYQNPTGYLSLVEDILKDPSLSFPPQSLDLFNMKEVNQYQSINSFVTTQAEGLRFQVVAHRQKSLATSKETISNISEEKILSWIPATTYSTFTGQNINQKWQIISKLLSAQPKTASGLKDFRNLFRSNTGLDVDRDIINWMDGEYALFFYPTQGGFFKSISPNLNLGIGLSFQTSNPQAVSNTLDKLDKFIQTFSKNEVTVSKSTVNGNSVTSWESQNNSTQSLLAYSWLNDNTVMITTGKGAIADLVPQPYVSLPSAYNFKTATNSFPRPNQGYFYMNMGSVLSWAYSFLPSEYNNPYFQIFKQAIGSVYSISSTSSTMAQREQFDFLVVLAPVRKELNRVETIKQ